MPNSEPAKVPKVSVIVPNYNHARYLARRLDSILQQSYQDYEIIILDDASTDESKSVIAGYLKDFRVSFYPNERNSGTPFAQWNKGVQLAKGEYIWIAESDDVAEPAFLETLVRLLDANPQVGFAHCQSLRIGPNEEPLGSLEDWTQDLDPGRWKAGFVNLGREECRQYLLWKNTVPNASAVLFRKAVYLKSLGAPENMRLCGDWLTWVRMLLISDIAFTGLCLNRFRKHNAAVRENTGERKHFDEKWTVQRLVLQTCKLDKAAQQKLGGQVLWEYANRINQASFFARYREMGRGMILYWPVLSKIPLRTTRVILQCSLHI